MKKTLIAGAGVAALAMAALPMAGVFAADVTDTLSVTISPACTLGYTSTGQHTAETNHGSWSSNTLSRTLANGSADTTIGSTTMTISCNDVGGYKVTLDASALSGGTGTTIASKTIPYITTASAPVAGTSSWGVSTGTTPTWILDDGTVTDGTGAVSGQTFTVTYGAATSATQEAGTYTGTAAYIISHPKTT